MIPFADLIAQQAGIRPELDAAIADILDRGEFVLGSRVAEFERAFAAYCGAAEGIGVNSGTSALHLALLAAGVGPGDEVITTAFTFVATVAAIGYTGARPVLVDIDPGTLALDPAQVARAITPHTKAIVPVHLYGQPADMDPILDIARHHQVAVIEDAAQAHGAEYRGRRVGSLGDAGCFSFYPSKNLGACGEAGMVVTSRPEWASRLRRLRDWGQAGAYRHVEKGFNYRMHGLQGAILGVKLRHLDRWTARRREIAARYDRIVPRAGLTRLVPRAGDRHVYHIYAVRIRNRALVRDEFAARGIETRVHYPEPIHLVDAWRCLGHGPGAFPEAERAAREVMSIPVHPELSDVQVACVAEALAGGLRYEAPRASAREPARSERIRSAGGGA